MNTFTAYMDKITAKSQLYKAKLLDDSVAEMKAKIKSKKADLEIKFTEEVNHAKKLEKQLETKINEAKDATEKQQTEIKKEFDDLVEQLDTSWNKIKNSFQDA